MGRQPSRIAKAKSGERQDAANGAFRQTPPVCDRLDQVRTTFEQFVPPAAGIGDEGDLFAIALSFQVSRSHDDRPGAAVLKGRERQVEPDRASLGIRHRVRFGVHATLRAPDQASPLVVGPFFDRGLVGVQCAFR